MTDDQYGFDMELSNGAEILKAATAESISAAWEQLQDGSVVMSEVVETSEVVAILEARDELDLFGGEIAAPPALDRDALAQALSNVMSRMSLRDVVSVITNPYRELIEYMSLAQGNKAAQRLSLLFNPHRLDVKTATSKQSIYQAIQTNESFHSGLARATIFKQSQYTGSELFYSTIQLGINGVQYVNEFPPHVARDFCKQFGLSSESKVLDPCAGWGGRMIGTSVVCNSYTCYEPSTLTVTGLLGLRDFIRAVKPEFDAEIHCLPYEDSHELWDHYDFAITSPPYYDSEEYSDEPTNSLNRYATFEDWCAGFYLPLIDKTMRQLKPGASFVLNIGNRRWPLSERMIAHSEGKYSVRELGARLVTHGLGKDPSKGEVFYVLEKETK